MKQFKINISFFKMIWILMFIMIFSVFSCNDQEPEFQPSKPLGSLSDVNDEENTIFLYSSAEDSVEITSSSGRTEAKPALRKISLYVGRNFPWTISSLPLKLVTTNALIHFTLRDDDKVIKTWTLDDKLLPLLAHAPTGGSQGRAPYYTEWSMYDMTRVNLMLNSSGQSLKSGNRYMLDIILQIVGPYSNHNYGVAKAETTNPKDILWKYSVYHGWLKAYDGATPVGGTPDALAMKTTLILNDKEKTDFNTIPKDEHEFYVTWLYDVGSNITLMYRQYFTFDDRLNLQVP